MSGMSSKKTGSSIKTRNYTSPLSEIKGRKPISQSEIRERVRNELSKYVLRMEKVAFQNLPVKNSEIREHVLKTIRKVAGA